MAASLNGEDSVIFERFDRDQYQLQLCQLDALRQTGSVADYLDRFEQLSHGILLYNSSYDDTYFVVRFLGGLKEEIRAAIALHQPKDVQTASTLAILQEEEIENTKRRGLPYFEHRDSMKSAPRANSVEKGKFPARRDNPEKNGKPDKDDKLSALIAHRKKLGLCFKCGEKWSHCHRCPQQIPLHVLEEILDAIEPDEDCIDEASDLTSDSESPILAIADKATSCLNTRKTMKLLGTIGKQQVLILVDSGSIGTFVSHSLVSKLQLSTEPCAESSYKSASGGTMICNSVVPQLSWLVQGHTFLSDASVESPVL